MQGGGGEGEGTGSERLICPLLSPLVRSGTDKSPVCQPVAAATAYLALKGKLDLRHLSNGCSRREDGMREI